jgi:hypothetical protein
VHQDGIGPLRKEIKMTYYVTALTNDKARLIAKEMRVSCRNTAEAVAINWEDQGYIVTQRKEA